MAELNPTLVAHDFQSITQAIIAQPIAKAEVQS